MDLTDYSDGELIKKYIDLRAFKKVLAEKHKVEIAPYDTGMELIENVMLGRLNERGANNSATPEGTAYKSETVKASVKDRDAYLAFVMGQWDQWGDMLMMGAQIDAVKRWLEHYTTPTEKPPPIPGVELDFRINCNIRRS